MIVDKSRTALRSASPYSAVITRERFLFHEVRTTAGLLMEGLSEDEAVKKIIDENLFQYPTEKSLTRMARACLRRLSSLGDKSLIEAIATQPSDVAKQICLYAMMKQYRLVWDFMITVIGEKYRLLDMTFTKMNMNEFFMQLQEQDEWVATWTDSTITRIKSEFRNILKENQYIDSVKSEVLRPVLISPILENAIHANGDERALTAFNCFS